MGQTEGHGHARRLSLWDGYYNAEEATVEDSKVITNAREMVLASHSLKELVVYSPTLTDTEAETLRRSIRTDQQHLILKMFRPKGTALQMDKLTDAEVKVILGFTENIANEEEYERVGSRTQRTGLQCRRSAQS
ncbi:hypothetical protein SGCOL_009843 [Colletotrichum sp. CLE4]